MNLYIYNDFYAFPFLKRVDIPVSADREHAKHINIIFYVAQLYSFNVKWPYFTHKLFVSNIETEV